MSGGTLHRAWAADLTPTQLYAMLALRAEVFVVEQDSPYQDLDGRDLDPTTRHFWVSSDDGPAAYLRLVELPDGALRIGRVCVAKRARGTGLARRLIEAALADVGDGECVLHAQAHLIGMYRAFGFSVDGEQYVEDGIAHVPMRRPAKI
ncbi:MAG: GNAT family N-acetyltransferase [Sciscionella sp.]|nr:GNAT family N-acetyltransferase [Sciscionella sp.]